MQASNRVFAEEVEFAGTRIRAGEQVLVLLGSANHDEAVFENAADLDIRRPNARKQLGLGLGPHYCLGAHLTHLEAAVTFATLARRFPAMRIASDCLEWLPRYSVRGVRALRLSL